MFSFCLLLVPASSWLFTFSSRLCSVWFPIMPCLLLCCAVLFVFLCGFFFCSLGSSPLEVVGGFFLFVFVVVVVGPQGRSMARHFPFVPLFCCFSALLPSRSSTWKGFGCRVVQCSSLLLLCCFALPGIFTLGGGLLFLLTILVTRSSAVSERRPILVLTGSPHLSSYPSRCGAAQNLNGFRKRRRGGASVVIVPFALTSVRHA